MDLQDLGAIGEVVGGVAVIATLIYLSIQLRQANVSTHRQMYAQAATSVSEFWLSMAKEPELYRLFATMLRSPEKLSDNEREQGFLVLDSYLSLMESYFLHNKEYGEKLSQERWEHVLRRIFNAPGADLYWKNRRLSFHQEFVDYIDSVIRQSL